MIERDVVRMDVCVWEGISDDPELVPIEPPRRAHQIIGGRASCSAVTEAVAKIN